MKRFVALIVTLVGVIGVSSGVPVDEQRTNFVSRQACAQKGIFPDGAEKVLGCTSIKELEDELMDAVSKIEVNSGNGTVDDVVKTITEKALGQLIDFVNTNSTLVSTYLESPMCLGDFDSNDVADTPDLVKSGCQALPLGADENWTMVAFNLPPISAICPEIPATNKMSMCLAFSLDCDNLPSVSISVNKGLIACLLGSTEAVASTGGISGLLAAGAEAVLDDVAAGISLSNAFSADGKIFTGEKGVETTTVKGTYHDHVQVSISPETFKLPDWVSLSGFMDRVVSTNNAAQEFSDLVAAFKPDGDLGDDILAVVKDLDISVLISGQIQYALKLKSVTKGILPDIPTQELAEFSAFATTFEQTSNGGTKLLPGFYLSASASNPAIQVIKAIGSKILQALDGPLSFVDWFTGLDLDTEVAKLLDEIDDTDTDALDFGLLVNTKQVVIMFGAGLTSKLSIKVSCVYDYSNDTFSCHVQVGGVDKFMTATLQTIEGEVAWVMSEASDFFESTGKVIAASVVDAAGTVEAFSKKAVQKTADLIEDAADGVSSELDSWAHSAVAICGTSVITDAAKCGSDLVVDGAKCGFSTVTSAAQCGTSVISSAADCGTQVVSDGAVCGFDTVTDGAKCGFDTVTSCLTSFFTNCKKAKSCQVPKSCSIALSCDVPNTCQIENSCSLPKSCSIPIAC
ncbi:hypothetical protein NDN08_004407 [Rhodosorus marinus]|uniref:Uncharacterized protein n=1 Tax=Rhodosorus marinus TaxID=101924 RepID=A0AAV8UNY4_9RHOD|nr:hypothetical protein NDN08_004407 [Rhodosorus marinus]